MKVKTELIISKKKFFVISPLRHMSRSLDSSMCRFRGRVSDKYNWGSLLPLTPTFTR